MWSAPSRDMESAPPPLRFACVACSVFPGLRYEVESGVHSGNSVLLALSETTVAATRFSGNLTTSVQASLFYGLPLGRK